MASVILKWKKFGTTRAPLRAGRPAKLSNRGRRALVREVTNNPNGHSGAELQRSSVEIGETSRGTTLHRSGLHGSVARRKSLFTERRMKARLELAKNHLKDSDCEKQDSLGWWSHAWTVWPQFQASCLEETRHHGCGGVFQRQGLGLVRVEGKLNGPKCRDILH